MFTFPGTPLSKRQPSLPAATGEGAAAAAPAPSSSLRSATGAPPPVLQRSVTGAAAASASSSSSPLTGNKRGSSSSSSSSSAAASAAGNKKSKPNTDAIRSWTTIWWLLCKVLLEEFHMEPRSSRIMEHCKVYPLAQRRRNDFVLAQVPRGMVKDSALGKRLVVWVEHLGDDNVFTRRTRLVSPKAFKLRPELANDSAFKKRFFLGDMILLPDSTDAKKKYAFTLKKEDLHGFLRSLGHPLSRRPLCNYSAITADLTEFETKYLRFNPYFSYEVETQKDGTQKKTFKFKSPFNEANPNSGEWHPIKNMAQTMYDFVEANCAGKDGRFFGDSIFYGKKAKQLAEFLGGNAPTGKFEHKIDFATGKDGKQCGPQEPNWVPIRDVTPAGVFGLGAVLTRLRTDDTGRHVKAAYVVEEDRYFGKPEAPELPKGAQLVVCGTDLVPFLAEGEAAKAHAMYEEKKDVPRMQHYLMREGLDGKDQFILNELQRNE